MDGVTVVDHVLLKRLLSILRDKDTPHRVFRETLTDAALILGYEAMRGLRGTDVHVDTPLEGADGTRLADEVFTPDSSRYWRADDYQEGTIQQSFDKQFVRNWLTGPESGWDRDGDKPPPPLPPDVVDATRARYIEAYERISGRKFSDWIKP